MLADAETVLRHAGEWRAQGPVLPPEGERGIVRTDSRKIQPGDVFIAYSGVASDGHAHLGAAVAKGAALLIVEDPAQVPVDCPVPWIACRSGRAAWTYLAAHAHRIDATSLAMLGVTGTNGKTSTVWMTGELLRAAGIPCVTIGTLGAYVAGEHIETGHTTPDPDVLYGILALARQRSVKIGAMEVSSHAIVQEKVLPLRYQACAFTSFTRDHLDFHKTMDAYFEAKSELFSRLSAPGAHHILWQGLADELPLPSLVAAEGGETFVYGTAPSVVAKALAARGVQIKVHAMSFRGTKLTLTVDGRIFSGEVPYFAAHALENFAAAWLMASKGAGRLLESKLWGRMRPVPGRLEQVTAGKGKTAVVVDYAHTPDALEKTLAVLRPLCRGRLAVVFGCGGDRDRGKRPIMGRIAEAMADRVYLTSDNPRTEPPLAILDEIRAGLVRPDAATLEADRAKAIAQAIDESDPVDLVLIAGKGHETYQILNDRTIAFDDREVARAALEG
jgi:UDP-N-acetylmuramoyl-L-alanyl-D-glutamate--2,6-diaminopimelate ligase